MIINPDTKLLLATIVIVLVSFFGLASLFSGSYESNDSNKTIDASELIKEDSPTKGSKDAKVTIVEFLDPECEACKAANPMVKKILADNPDTVRLVVRYFPLHGNSVLASRAIEFAGEQGKYWEMMDKLFENQSAWGEKKEPQIDLFTKYAKELGFDALAFREGLNATKYTDKIERDKTDGLALGIDGTPTFFVNGKEVKNIGNLTSIVESEIQK